MGSRGGTVRPLPTPGPGRPAADTLATGPTHRRPADDPPAIESFRRRERAPEISESAARRSLDAIAVLEGALDGRRHLVGDSFSVADLIGSEVVRVATRVGVYEPRGRLAEYLVLTEARPARQRAAPKMP